MSAELQYDQAVTLLKQRADAQDNLITFSRLIDIPAVPSEVSSEEWSVVETPLASHHLLTLYALQSMTCGRLLYNPDDLRPLTQPTPQGLVWCDAVTAPVGRPDRGGDHIYIHDPSLNPTPQKLPSPPPVQKHEQKYTHKNSDTSKVSQIPDETLPSAVEPSGILIPADIPKQLLKDVKHEVCRRVMLMMPPGSAKSTYASVVFPVWEMGRTPDEEVILTGWGDPICRRHGKRARKICESDLYKGIMNSGLDPNTRAAEDWALTNGSTYKSSGINSGVAGFRCGGLVWDDLTKNRKEADSQTIRDDTYNAYIDDARSRKKPDAWEVGIGTRWHEDEIMGRVLPEGYTGESGYMRCRDGNVWLVICLAAECERDDDPLGREVGEMLWPEWFGEGYWAEKRVNPRSWGSLYQQRPAPEEGVFFKKEWFKFYEVLPHGDSYIAYDPAVSEEEDGDDTAIQVWRVDEFARLYLAEEWVRKCTMDIWIKQLLMMAIRHKPLEIISEMGVIRKASEPFIKRAMLKLKAFFMFEWVHRHANKPAMARGAQAMTAAGQVFVPDTPEGHKFVDECLRFPTSKDDHRVDAFVNLCLRLEVLFAANPPKKTIEKSDIIGGDEISIKKLMPERFPKRKSKWKRTYRIQ